MLGAGGSISSQNDSVVTVVHVDGNGVEGTTELPSGVSVREGTIVRLDYLDGALFAVRNVTGGQGTRLLLSAADFIVGPALKKRDFALTVLAVMALGAGDLPLIPLLLVRPAWVVWRNVQARKDRERLNDYMSTVAS